MSEQKIHCRQTDLVTINTSAGGSLLEVLASLTLILLVLTGILPVMLAGINSVQMAGQRTTACTYAESLLEELKMQPEWLQGRPMNIWIQADALPFTVPDQSGLEACISLSALDGGRALYQVNVRVAGTRGEVQWEENLIGIVQGEPPQ